MAISLLPSPSVLLSYGRYRRFSLFVIPCSRFPSANWRTTQASKYQYGVNPGHFAAADGSTERVSNLCLRKRICSFSSRSNDKGVPRKLVQMETEVEADNEEDDLEEDDADDEEDEYGDLDEQLMDEGDEFEDDDMEDDEFPDEDEDDVMAGDGGDGGGIVFGDTSWGEKALAVAQQALVSYEDLDFYAFKVSTAGRVHVRLDKLSDKYGSPTLEEIQKFSSLYSAGLEEAAQKGDVPKNLSLEVSSPGAERFVRVPKDLTRFKALPMHVQYIEDDVEKSGVFDLESLDIDAGSCTWKLANVKVNRDLAGKGRGLNRKQRTWNLKLNFSAMKFVRLHLDV